MSSFSARPERSCEKRGAGALCRQTIRMHKIVSKARLSPNVTRLDVEAPRIAQVRKPGQFVIVQQGEGAERIPLTIADADPVAGTIALVIQAVGKSTRELVALEPGEAIADIAGPLGQAYGADRVRPGALHRRRRRHRGRASDRPGPSPERGVALSASSAGAPASGSFSSRS